MLCVIKVMLKLIMNFLGFVIKVMLKLITNFLDFVIKVMLKTFMTINGSLRLCDYSRIKLNFVSLELN